MKTLAASLIPAAFLTAATLAAAAAGDVSFAYSKGDLASSSSISALYDRMTDKAEQTCAIYQNSHLWGVQYQRACAAVVLDEFVAGIDHPTLTALHEERDGARFAERT